MTRSMKTRLWIIRTELETARDEKDLARLMIVIGEAIHTGHVTGVTVELRRPVVSVALKLSGPPWNAEYNSRLLLH